MGGCWGPGDIVNLPPNLYFLSNYSYFHILVFLAKSGKNGPKMGLNKGGLLCSCNVALDIKKNIFAFCPSRGSNPRPLRHDISPLYRGTYKTV